MKMSKKFKGACAVLAATTAITATSIGAANYSKTINATYKNIRVNYNGTVSSLSTEPFLVDGSTYVPLRAVSEVMGADVKWDGTNNMVMITGASATDSSQLASLQQDVSLKEAQIQSLNAQITQLQAELATYKSSSSSSSSSSTSSTSGTDITTAELTATEDLLNNDYDNELSDDIDMEYDLTKKSSSLRLVLSYTEKSENTAFNNCSEKKVSNYLEDICALVAERHADIAITGSIEYKDSELVTFEYSKKGKLTVTYAYDEDDVETYITNNFDDFTVYGESVSIKDVSVSIGSSSITCTLSIDPNSDKDFLNTWNSKESKIYDFLDDMASDIMRNFSIDEDEYTLFIEVENSDDNNTIAKYSSAKTSLTSYVDNLSE